MANNLISFRLDPTHLELLRQQAGADTSPGTYARELVVRALNGQVLNDAVADRLLEIQERQDHLRKDLRILFKSLVAASQRYSAEELDALVNRVLR